MEYKTVELLNKIHSLVNNSVRIVNLVVLKRTELFTIIDEIYESIPVDINKARKGFSEKSSDEATKLFKTLKDFEIEIDNSFTIGNLFIISGRKITKLLANVNENLPNELKKF